MIQYRGNTFETNSSSAHSLVIMNTPCEHYTPEEAVNDLWLYYDKKTGVYAPHGDLYFGRYPFRILYTFEDKLKYAYACAPIRVQMRNGKKYYSRRYHNISRVVSNFIPGYRRVEFSRFYGRPSTDDSMLFHWLKKANMSLIEFLTNKQVMVICDGDEYNMWYHMKEKGLINVNNIGEEY